MTSLLDRAYNAYYKGEDLETTIKQHPTTPIEDYDNGYIIFYNVNGLLSAWKIVDDKIRGVRTKKELKKVDDLYF